MCLIAIAINQSEQYPIILLSNRDEFYNRSTEKMHWWKDRDILAGKDLQAGGTWLAINSKGHFAAVTNYRNPKHNDPKASSRGAIPLDLVEDTPYDFTLYVSNQQEYWDKMNGFNLLYYNENNVFYYSNISKNIQKLEDGVHALSNAFVNTPWPKVEQIKSDLKKLLKQNLIDEQYFLNILGQDKKFPKDTLPNTGVGIVMEEILSPICIHSPVYGTRTHTVITVSQDKVVNVVEKQVKEKSIQRFNFVCS